MVGRTNTTHFGSPDEAFAAESVDGRGEGEAGEDVSEVRQVREDPAQDLRTGSAEQDALE